MRFLLLLNILVALSACGTTEDFQGQDNFRDAEVEFINAERRLNQLKINFRTTVDEEDDDLTHIQVQLMQGLAKKHYGKLQKVSDEQWNELKEGLEIFTSTGKGLAELGERSQVRERNIAGVEAALKVKLSENISQAFASAFKQCQNFSLVIDRLAAGTRSYCPSDAVDTSGDEEPVDVRTGLEGANSLAQNALDHLRYLGCKVTLEKMQCPLSNTVVQADELLSALAEWQRAVANDPGLAPKADLLLSVSEAEADKVTALRDRLQDSN